MYSLGVLSIKAINILNYLSTFLVFQVCYLVSFVIVTSNDPLFLNLFEKG